MAVGFAVLHELSVKFSLMGPNDFIEGLSQDISKGGKGKIGAMAKVSIGLENHAFRIHGTFGMHKFQGILEIGFE